LTGYHFKSTDYTAKLLQGNSTYKRTTWARHIALFSLIETKTIPEMKANDPGMPLLKLGWIINVKIRV